MIAMTELPVTDRASLTLPELPAVPLPMLVRRLRAAGEPSRLRLLCLLAAGELTVSELTSILGQSQPRVSRHLKLLLDAGLIERLPEGAWVFYRLADDSQPGSGGAFGRRLISELKSDDKVLAADLERLAAVKAARASEASDYFAANAAKWAELRQLYLPDADIEAAMLELLGPEPTDLLIDLGTGTGRVLEALKPLYKRAIGFDVSHPMLGVARVNLEKAGVREAHVRHGDLFSLPQPLERAGVVVLHQVLHYLDNPGAAVQAATRLLSPGGRLLIVDFAPHTHEYLRNDHAHRRLGFSDEEMTRWCRAAGLNAVTVRHLGREEKETLTVSLWLAAETAPALKVRKKELA